MLPLAYLLLTSTVLADSPKSHQPMSLVDTILFRWPREKGPNFINEKLGEFPLDEDSIQQIKVILEYPKFDYLRHYEMIVDGEDRQRELFSNCFMNRELHSTFFSPMRLLKNRVLAELVGETIKNHLAVEPDRILRASPIYFGNFFDERVVSDYFKQLYLMNKELAMKFLEYAVECQMSTVNSVDWLRSFLEVAVTADAMKLFTMLVDYQEMTPELYEQFILKYSNKNSEALMLSILLPDGLESGEFFVRCVMSTLGSLDEVQGRCESAFPNLSDPVFVKEELGDMAEERTDRLFHATLLRYTVKYYYVTESKIWGKVWEEPEDDLTDSASGYGTDYGSDDYTNDDDGDDSMNSESSGNGSRVNSKKDTTRESEKEKGEYSDQEKEKDKEQSEGDEYESEGEEEAEDGDEAERAKGVVLPFQNVKFSVLPPVSVKMTPYYMMVEVRKRGELPRRLWPLRDLPLEERFNHWLRARTVCLDEPPIPREELLVYLGDLAQMSLDVNRRLVEPPSKRMSEEFMDITGDYINELRGSDMTSDQINTDAGEIMLVGMAFALSEGRCFDLTNSVLPKVSNRDEFGLQQHFTFQEISALLSCDTEAEKEK